ncbi:MAG: phage tail assembly chaperone [Rhodobacteraceae bacterium]|nr:phage tail assembly chaperone [Paracoccaceae bacterium]
MNGFDWPALMRAGLGGLGLRPQEFWDLTPVELLLMLGLDGGGAPRLNRARLHELSAEFPDETRE